MRQGARAQQGAARPRGGRHGRLRLQRGLHQQAVPHQDQPDTDEGDERGAEGDGGARVPGPPVPDRRGHRARHEDAQGALAQPAHLGALQPAQVPRQARRPEEAHRVADGPRLHGARPRQPQPVQLRRVTEPSPRMRTRCALLKYTLSSKPSLICVPSSAKRSGLRRRRAG